MEIPQKSCSRFTSSERDAHTTLSPSAPSAPPTPSAPSAPSAPPATMLAAPRYYILNSFFNLYPKICSIIRVAC